MMTEDGRAEGYVNGMGEVLHLCWLWDGCLEVKAWQGYSLCRWREGACVPGNVSV